MASIFLRNISFKYPNAAEELFSGINLSLDTDWKLGLIGRNGRGKTTLLKILSGELEISGKIDCSGGFEYFPYALPDSAFLGLDGAMHINPAVESWRLEKELRLLGCDEDVLYRELSTLSGGERCKLMLAAMFTKEGRFMLIDEPTNHLDAAGRVAAQEYLAKKRGYIVASHDRMLLEGATDHILAINHKGLRVYNCGFSDYLAAERDAEVFEKKQSDRLLADIKRLKKSRSMTREWAANAESKKLSGRNNASGLKPDKGFMGAKAARLMKRAKVMERRLDSAIAEAEELVTKAEQTGEIRTKYLPHGRELLLSVKELSFSFSEKEVLSGISFDIRRGDRISVVGSNGSGKSTLLKILCGELSGYNGSLSRASGLIISYMPQSTAFLCGTQSELIERHDLDEPLYRAILNKLGFEQKHFAARLENLSEGQKKKVLLAHSLSKEANLYVWDEPLNYIDMTSRLQIEEMLARDCTIIFVEHDAVFCDKLADIEICLDK